MNIYISGEKGFVAKNLIAQIKFNKDLNINVVNNEYRRFRYLEYNDKEEIDFVKTDCNYLIQFITDNDIELVIHNGAIVGTDVCAMYQKKTIETNVYGTYNLASACELTETPMIYLGTTVIYNVRSEKVQSGKIDESTEIKPRTLYGITKYEGELHIEALLENVGYAILRPLFCYGGVGDMNSLIAKTIYNFYSENPHYFKIFLDSSKNKDYMHIYDFSQAIIEAINYRLYEKNEDYNIAFEEGRNTGQIYRTICSVAKINHDYVKWVPKTDYLGNHLIDSDKFRRETDWNPQVTLEEGIKFFMNDMKNNEIESYNPLMHLDRIQEQNINIEQYYR